MKIKIFVRQLRNLIFSNVWKLLQCFISKTKNSNVEFIVENADWAIKRVGNYICKEISISSNIKIKNSSKPYKSFGDVIHFGSQYMWVDWSQYLSKKHHYVVSFFHGSFEDGPDIVKHIEEFLKSVPKLSKIIVSNSIVEERLINWGINPNKIVRIPIGVDMELFKIPNNNEKKNARNLFNFSKNTIVIGSFQKDGIGWGDGMEPKNVKGPDIFLKVLSIVKKSYNISVLLTGPARGYIKAGLEDLDIPYHHTYVDKYSDLTQCYYALDLYLITSREEGGPMGLMESMSCGVPVVSSPVGMSNDFIINGINGLISKETSAESISKSLIAALKLIDQKKFNKVETRANIKPCSWPEVARSHLEMVYKPLLDKPK